ncbi:MAG TPA: hypothetical protein VF941_01280 [Clostridia bacterium]
MGFLDGFFQGDKDEILFFILVFLFLFNGNFLGRSSEEEAGFDGSTILFFVVLFLLLFINTEHSPLTREEEENALVPEVA